MKRRHCTMLRKPTKSPRSVTVKSTSQSAVECRWHFAKHGPSSSAHQLLFGGVPVTAASHRASLSVPTPLRKLLSPSARSAVFGEGSDDVIFYCLSSYGFML
ncbi:hypothetical protein CEXT_419751 [Caerostris extrusa]|uniref:Uncharacterized protein n=1 Tax=Caerostris extrusa TaxID=172846 RepID=A0AAV4TC08_CAEEX|nr:hypothetical protein CEXT_419751 [Caerostris extrusa]